MRARAPIAALVCLLACALARPAAAGDEAASAHYKKGRSLYNISEYRAALDEFKAAYVEHEDAAFLYNIAQCHRQLGNYPEAITFYKRFLAESPKAPNRKEIQRLISDLEGKTNGAPPPAPPPDQPPVVGAPTGDAQPSPPPIPVAAPTPTPPEAPTPHAGLHLELGLGGGGFNDTFTWNGIVGSANGTATGGSGAFQLAATYGILPRLAIGAIGAIEAVQSPKVQTGGVTNNDISVGTLGFLGAMADFRLHPGPTGWHFEGAIGGARITAKDKSGVVAPSSPVGGGIALAAGYDWALGPSWQLGVLGRLIAVSLTAPNVTHQAEALSALLVVSYH